MEGTAQTSTEGRFGGSLDTSLPVFVQANLDSPELCRNFPGFQLWKPFVARRSRRAIATLGFRVSFEFCNLLVEFPSSVVGSRAMSGRKAFAAALRAGTRRLALSQAAKQSTTFSSGVVDGGAASPFLTNTARAIVSGLATKNVTVVGGAATAMFAVKRAMSSSNDKPGGRYHHRPFRFALEPSGCGVFWLPMWI